MLVFLWASFYLGERFFFDKLFYKKSLLHGYYNRYQLETPPTNWLDKQLILLRERDLQLLLKGQLKPDLNSNLKTIVVIGDSYTYGVGVLPHERFSHQISLILNKQGTKTKVYNFSEPGNSIIDNFSLYLLAKNQLQPDLIIFEMVTNDLLFNAPRYPGTAQLIKNLDSHCLQPLFVNPNTFTTTDAQYLASEIESFKPEWRNRCYLEQISKYLSNDPKVMFFGFLNGSTDFNCTWANKYPDGLLITEYAALIKLYGNSVHLHDAVDDSSISVSKTEGHPSRSAHKTYAEDQVEWINLMFESSQEK